MPARVVAAEAHADEPPPPKSDYRVGLFESLGTNIAESLGGPNLLLHATAIGSAAALSVSGADGEIQRRFWRDSVILGGTVSDVAFIGGWFTPAVIPGVIALTGSAANDDETASAGVTALQAVGINALVTQLVKFVTGRPLPYENGVPNDDERLLRSEDGAKWFSFGGFAWPSGHTSSHMALASSLVAFYPEKRWLPFAAYPLVVVVGVSMIEGDHHWSSDVVAGRRRTCGACCCPRSSRSCDRPSRHGKPVDDASAVQVRPMVTRDTFMLMLSFSFRHEREHPVVLRARRTSDADLMGKRSSTLHPEDPREPSHSAAAIVCITRCMSTGARAPKTRVARGYTDRTRPAA